MAMPLDIFVSILPQKWLVEQIGGDLVTPHVLVDKGQEPHNFSPTPKQIATLFRARLYFTLDLEFEKAIIGRIKSSAQNLQIINTASGIDKIPISIVGQGKNMNSGHVEGLDPHIWLDPRNLLLMAQNMARAMSAADPEHESVYDKNLKSITAKLDDLYKTLLQQLAPYRGASFFVFHPAFGYFAHAFGLQQRAVEAGGKSPGPKQLRALISLARSENVRVIFVQPQFDPKSAAAVASAIGGEVVPLDSLAEDVPGNLKKMAQKILSALHEQ
jgi:zinc transport system substrate-binding protein